MSHSTSRIAMMVGAVVALGSTAALAQQLSEIVVEAPRVHRTGEVGSSGGPIDMISVTHRVSFKDIDISTSSGAKVLEQRVKDSATAACKEIDKLYPLREPVPSQPDCVTGAVNASMAQVKAAIAAAEKNRPK